MKKEYELLSREKIDLSLCSTDECEHISKIEKLIESSADYFEVYRQAFVPLQEGKHFTGEDLRKLRASPHYKIALDLVERHRQKYFSG